jgi:hypothetical protein
MTTEARTSSPMEGDDMEMLALFGQRRRSTSLEGRRERETRPIAQADRAISGGAHKTKQLNVTVTPEFYERFAGFAVDQGLSKVQLIERAVMFYMANAPRATSVYRNGAHASG